MIPVPNNNNNRACTFVQLIKQKVDSDRMLKVVIEDTNMAIFYQIFCYVVMYL